MQWIYHEVSRVVSGECGGITCGSNTHISWTLLPATYFEPGYDFSPGSAADNLEGAVNFGPGPDQLLTECIAHWSNAEAWNSSHQQHASGGLNHSQHVFIPHWKLYVVKVWKGCE